MPTLKTNTNEYFEVYANDLNDFIAEVTGVESFRVEETEWYYSSVPNKTIYVDGYTNEGYEDDYDKFLCGNIEIDFDTIMNILCADGWIPEGHYIVLSNW